MAKTSSRLFATTIPKAELAKKKSSVPSGLQAKNWRGDAKQRKAFAELVGKVRRGEIAKKDHEAILATSVKKLTEGKSKSASAWKAFFKKHGGDDLVAIQWAHEIGMADLLAASGLPRITSSSGSQIITFEFIRLDKATIGARFHLVDDGEYKGTIVKAVAPLAPFVDPKASRESEAMLRMVTAGAPQHAADLLVTALDVRSMDTDVPVHMEIGMLSSTPEIIRGSGAWSRFPWPKGVDVRKPTGLLNIL